jgi:quercetin dioxygenase-like cupin family protein
MASVDLLPGSASPMHRTNSLDYGIVICGLLELELEDGSVTRLKPGNVVVQRGTNHLWRNPDPSTICRMVFILIDSEPVVINGQPLPEMPP